MDVLICLFYYIGPKGVKRDYNEAKKNAKINRIFDGMRRDRAMKDMATGAQQFYLEDSATTAAPKKAKKEFWESDAEEDDNSEDDELFEKYKRERIQQVQATLPSYGAYARAYTFEELASLINKNHELVWIVVHVYENDNAACLALHLSFEALARQFPHTCFIRIRSDAAMKNFHAMGLPTLLLYRGKELKHSLIALYRTLGASPSDRDVAQLLADHDVLRVPTGGVEKLSIKDKKKWMDGYESGNDADGGKSGVKQGLKHAHEDDEEGPRRYIRGEVDSEFDWSD